VHYSSQQGEGIEMQGMAGKFSPVGPRRIWNRSNCTPKSLKNFRDNALQPCRMPLALTLQRKNRKPLGAHAVMLHSEVRAKAKNDVTQLKQISHSRYGSAHRRSQPLWQYL